MEDKKPEIDNNSNTINEKNLEEVAGGKNYKGCWFTPKGPEKDLNGILWLECNSTCQVFFDVCDCHGANWCIDRWHRVEKDYYLFSKEFTNHSKKTPRKYNT